MDKLTSPFPPQEGKDVEWVHTSLPPDIFNYFFRHIYAGERGPRQYMVQLFFQKLYEQCKSAGITADWQNAGAVNDIISRLNFEPRSERSARTRRTDKSTSKPKKQSPVSTGDGGRTSDSRSEAPHTGDVSTNPIL